MPGPKAVYRGKLRDKPVTIPLTKLGHQRMREGMKRRKMSRPDYVEQLVHEDYARAHEPQAVVAG